MFVGGSEEAFPLAARRGDSVGGLEGSMRGCQARGEAFAGRWDGVMGWMGDAWVMLGLARRGSGTVLYHRTTVYCSSETTLRDTQLDEGIPIVLPVLREAHSERP